MAKEKWKNYTELLINTYSTNEIFTKEELEEVFQEKIHSSSLKALLSRNILIPIENGYHLGEIDSTIFEKSKKESGHTKDKNADFGKYFEKCISFRSYGYIEKPELDESCCKLTNKEMDSIWEDSKYIIPYLNGMKASWVGKNTINGNGDLVLDDRTIIEIKYIGNDSKGTYFNGTIYNLTKYNFNLLNYFNDFNYYDLLENTLGTFGFHPNRINKSPYNVNLVSKKSPKLNAEQLKVYNSQVLPVATQMMTKFTKDFYNFIINDKNQLIDFIHFCLYKHENKTMPDRFIAFNYRNKNVNEFYDLHNLENSLNLDNIILNEKGINIDNKIRIQFSWKNGYGLYNPAMYVFL